MGKLSEGCKFFFGGVFLAKLIFASDFEKPCSWLYCKSCNPNWYKPYRPKIWNCLMFIYDDSFFHWAQALNNSMVHWGAVQFSGLTFHCLGRFDRKIEFPNPNEEARARILQIHSRKMNVRYIYIWMLNFYPLLQCFYDSAFTALIYIVVIDRLCNNRKLPIIDYSCHNLPDTDTDFIMTS